MSTLILTKEMMNDGQHITSIEIATLIGKPHNDRENFPRCKSGSHFLTGDTE